MALTREELERRRHFLTASEIPSILGLSPWSNAGDVYISKTQGIDWSGNDATHAGNLLEPTVIEWAKSQLGNVLQGDWLVHEDGIIACSLDGRLPTGEPVEAKTSGIVGPGSPHQWGNEGTDEIPEYYLVQVQTQLLVTGAARAYVPALIGNRGFVMYVVDANQELQGVIKTNAEAFWNEHIVPRIPPEDVRPHFDTLKRMIRTKGKSVEVSDDLVADYRLKNELAKRYQKDADEAKAALISAIGDGEIAKWSGGEFTFCEQTRKGYVVADSTFRVLREKTSKAKV